MALRHFTTSLAMLSAGLAGVAALAAADASAPPPPGVGLDLINERCGFCHTTAQTLDVRKTPDNWAITVQSMIDRGADLTPEEADAMVDYLAKNLALDGGASAPGVADGGVAQSMAPAPR